MHPRDDRGAGTVLALALIAVLLMMLTGGVALASAALASERARAAADSAALAGARAVSALGDSSPTGACAAATRFAGLNQATLVSCSVLGMDVSVRVQVRPSFPGLGPASATARAGALIR